MPEDKPNKDIIERAEDLILRLREVHSARIYTDEQGTITEIHVVAVTDRAPKLLARDVETCLKASLGLTVDYRKIGVVVIDPEKDAFSSVKDVDDASRSAGTEEQPVLDLEEVVDDRLAERSGERPGEKTGGQAGAEPEREDRPRAEEARLEFLENEARIRFKGLRVSIGDDRFDVEVRLVKGALVVTGSQGDFRFRGMLAEAIAGAALHAISELLDEDIHLCLSVVEEVTLGGRKALCAVVDAIRGRSVARYVGCVLVGEERDESAVFAVLDALNRPLGRWKLRKEIHYTIT